MSSPLNKNSLDAMFSTVQTNIELKKKLGSSNRRALHEVVHKPNYPLEFV